MRRWSLLLLAVVTACGGDGACPQIGCVSQLTVELPPEAVSARACAAGVCTTEVVDGALQVPLSRRGDASAVEVTVELVDAAGTPTTVTGSAPVRLTRPNGDACPPVCINGSVRVDAAQRVLVPLEEP